MSPEQVRSLRREIELRAHQLGFDLFGVTTPEPPNHLDVYDNWLEASRHGKMEYLASQRARQRRVDPLQILPECLSVIVLGIRYFKPDHLPSSETETQGKPTVSNGKISAYAWGDDYHEVLGKRIQQLVDFIEEQAGRPIPNRWYTDTGPVLEREFAQRAGLGWIGKNTCLINPQMGSYFFLAELFLELELEPDAPFTSDHCGNCTRCLEACPTKCILPDRTIDSRQCISYLTIELKGPIPEEMRTQTGNWIFGCDICQQVCPWNLRFSSEKGDTAFAPRPGLKNPDMIQELTLNAMQFNKKFKDSPVKRAKRRGYLRNVAVSIGNNPSSEMVSPLTKALIEDPEPLVRGHAAWGLARIGGEIAYQALKAASKKELDEYVQEEITAALRTCLD